MTRVKLVASVLALVLSGPQVLAQGPVFDDQGYHPSLLPRGSMEYEHALRRKQAPSRSIAPQELPLAEALKRCEAYLPLAQATREKCEIRARQTAAWPR
jgi:hypothetical protein